MGFSSLLINLSRNALCNFSFLFPGKKLCFSTAELPLNIYMFFNFVNPKKREKQEQRGSRGRRGENVK
jgi:hypothetical protein